VSEIGSISVLWWKGEGVLLQLYIHPTVNWEKADI